MKRTTPKFDSEAEEAKWWDEHLDELEDEMVEAIESGKATVLTRDRLAERIEHAKASGPVTIDLPEADVKRARRLASERGLDYETYLRSLLHDAIDRAAGTHVD